MAAQNYYAILGVPLFCDDQEKIRAAYLAQVKFFHPDVNNVPPDIAKEQTQLLNLIYNTLRDPKEKRSYDYSLKETAKQKKAKKKIDVLQFREAAIHSARSYFDFLEKKGRGNIKIQVSRITPSGSSFSLSLATRLSEASAADLDSLQFSFGGRLYSSHHVVPLQYDKNTATLRVRPQESLLAEFSSLSPDGLTLIYDLKFLVKRVGEWYTRLGRWIRLPQDAPDPPDIVCADGVTPSPEQLAAIRGALSEPFSYIWGAPGTGKTRVVLSSCVLSLVRAGRHVLLLAPTNNALEQMLYGVIPACQSAGIPLDRILRLGTPSHEFFQRYPDVCELRDVERNIQITVGKIHHIQKYFQFCSFRDDFTWAHLRIRELLQDMDATAAARLEALGKLEAVRLDAVQDRASNMLLRRETDQLMDSIRGLQKKLSGLSAWKKLFRTKSYLRDTAALETAMAELSEKKYWLDMLSEQIAEADRQYDIYAQRIAALENDFSAKRLELLDVTAFWSLLHSPASAITLEKWSAGADALAAALDEAQTILDDREAKYVDLAGRPYADLQAALEQLERRHALLLTGGSEERLKSIDILAVTLDKFISLDISAGAFQPNHVFLDEAGYCSLIKGITPLSLGVPVTFLGDHMQLPPICEMNDKDIRKDDHQDVCLWSQSTLFAECVFFQDIPDICENYLTNTAAPFLAMKKYNLDCTYRFGSSLASILAQMVYTPSFHSALQSETELLLLDAPHTEQRPGRVSAAEADAIEWYLAQAPAGNFAILTPYRDQVVLLTKRFRDFSREGRVMTIHASQGREWDTVFLSVVDTTNKFFTDSCKLTSRGMQVINTAVSRAKRRLILVCDSRYWRGQHGQLIGRLVDLAQSIN